MTLRRHDDLLMLWAHECLAPWQTRAWQEQVARQLRPNARVRMLENRFTSTDSALVEMAQWDACVDDNLRPVVSAPELNVWVGVDAGVKHDNAAIVACTWDESARRVRLVCHRIFRPTPENPLDFENTLERTLLDLYRRFYVRQILFDPWQLVRTSQLLTKKHLPMVEFPQSVPNLTESSSNLFDLIRDGNLAVYPDPEIRLAVSRSVAVEGARGWRIAKEKASHKIDIVVALAQAALGATKQKSARRESKVVPIVEGRAPRNGRTEWKEQEAMHLKAGCREDEAGTWHAPNDMDATKFHSSHPARQEWWTTN